MKGAIILALAAALAGCAQQSPTPFQPRIVPVISPAPYRFITYSLNDTPETRSQVRAHNRAHQAVLDAEKK